jgi:glycosyltransferase involved in cell wall biosynthesis
VVREALAVAQSTGLPVNVATIAEAVGSDVTYAVRESVSRGRLGVAAHLFSTYLAHDHCVAVSEYTRELVVSAATEIDEIFGTGYAEQCRRRVRVSYPAVDSAAYTDLDEREVEASLHRRGLERHGYVLFLSRLTPAKGVDDLIAGYARSSARHRARLVIAGTGPGAADLHRVAADSEVAERIVFLDDVDDTEKPHLMRGCAAYVLPSKPRPEFIETFGIALVETMLAGGGPVITTTTGGIPEAVGDTAFTFAAGDTGALARTLDEVMAMATAEREARAEKARKFAMQFDRMHVFDRLFDGL